MYTISAYQTRTNPAIITQSPMKRDWMDNTFDGHAYRCFPLSIANQLGFSFSYPKDITVEWDGNDSSEGHHIKVLEGAEYVDTGRGTATLIFLLGWRFVTEPNVTTLFYGPPNYIKDGASPLTNLISTSFYKNEPPVSWKITKPNTPITFKAHEPIMCALPLSLSALNESEITLNPDSRSKEHYAWGKAYDDAVRENNKIPKWSDFYRNGVDHLGNKIGEHELKKLKFNVIDLR